MGESNKTSKLLLFAMSLSELVVLAVAFIALRRYSSSFAFLIFLVGSGFVICEYALYDAVKRGWRIRDFSALASISLLVFFAILCGIVLESLTCFGYPGPFSLSHWLARRAAIFTGASLMVAIAAVWFSLDAQKPKAFSEIASFVKQVHPREWAISIGMVVCALVVSVIASNALGLSLKAMAIFSVSVALSIDALVLCRNVIGAHPEYPACLLMLFLGFALVTIPPSETGLSWDDQIHYANAVSLSYVTDAQANEAEEQLRFPPAETTTEVERLQFEALDTQYTQRELDQYDEALDRVSSILPTHTEGTSIQGLSYSFFGYIPSAVGFWLARVLKLPLSLQIDFGKWFNLLFYAWCTFVAVRVIPARKLVCSGILLIPCSVFIASNFTYDSWLTGLTAVAVAYTVRELCFPSQTMTRRSAALILLVFVLAFGPKPIYFPLIGIVLTMPRCKFPSKAGRRRFALAACLIAFVMLLSFAAPFFASSGNSVTDLRGGDDVNGTAQLAFVLNEPLSVFGILTKYLFGTYLPLHVPHFIVSFAYLNSAGLVWGLFCVLLLVVASLTDKFGEGGEFITGVGRVWILFVVLCVTYLMALALYISFNPVHSTSVEGMQGRYFFPLLIPLLIMCIPAVRLPRISVNAYSFVALSIWGLLIACCELALIVLRITA